MFTLNKKDVCSDLTENKVAIKLNKNIFKAQPVTVKPVEQSQIVKATCNCDEQAAALFEIY